MDTTGTAPGRPTAKRRKRPQLIADLLRNMIVEQDLKPGDRVPPDWLSLDRLKASRGTRREAINILETQGLVTSKTGPGGGLFISNIDPEHAVGLLGNLFLFDQPSIADIYALRKIVEPELAASLAGKLSPEAFALLQLTIRLYEDEPASAKEEYEQRLAELDFHAELARSCENRLLTLVAVFLVGLLRDMTVCHDIYSEPNPALRESGVNYQVRLLRAIKAGDADKARQIMRGHMVEAEAYMLERAAMRSRRAVVAV